MIRTKKMQLTGRASWLLGYNVFAAGLATDPISVIERRVRPEKE
jgi:hypothetical protein